MNDGTDPEAERGRLLMRQRRYAEAETHFGLALQSDPRNAAALYAVAICQLNQEGKERRALDTIDLALSLAPNDADYHAARAYILGHLEREAEAMAAADTAVGLDPASGYAWNAKGFVHDLRREWAAAEAAARQALAIDPDDPAAANRLAQSLRLQNRLAENEEQVRAMLARDPEDSATHANAGWAALQRGERGQAETHFLEALRLEPDSEWARQGLIEAFKGRSPLYRAYLRYCFFMQRFRRQTQWAIVLGVFLAARFARQLFRGEMAWVGALIGLAYALFVLWVHVAGGVGHFMLLVDRAARRALTPNEKADAVAVGGGIAVGLLMLIAGAASGWLPAVLAGAGLVLAAIPFAHTFTNRARAGRWLFGIIGACMLVAGAGLAIAHPLGGAARSGMQALFGIAVVACLLSTWLANVPVLRR